jgi:polysaccharide chain length determinant protein (PEP-CTERM system associated)
VTPLVEYILDEVRGAWRFRWTALVAAAAVAIVGWVVVFALPDRYQAMTSVFVDKRTALQPALQGQVVEQDVDAQLNFVRQSLLAGPQLLRVARATGLVPEGTDPRRQDQLLADLSKRVAIDVRSASGREEERNSAGSIYTVVYEDGNRARSLRVAKILLDMLVNDTLGAKRAGSQNAQQFLEAQIADYEKRLRTAEDRLAAFKSRHMGLMPTEQGGYFAQLQKESDAVADVKTKLAEAESRRAALTRQLHGDVAVAAAGPLPGAPGGAGGTAGSDTLSRIAEAQAHLDELLLKYTDRHPDVIAARQTLEELKQRRTAEVESLRHGDASAVAASRASSNPVYQSIQLALNQVDVDIADFNVELQQHQSKVTELRRYLDTAPQVEAEFAQLNRDYDVNKAQYTALLADLQKARLGEQADTAGSVRFEIVQPPTADFRPVWPPRLLMLAEVLVAALAAGAALAYGLHYLQPVVSSAGALAQLSGVPVLGLVGVAFPDRERRALRRDILRLSLALGCLIVAFAVALGISRAGYRLDVAALTHETRT